MRPERRATLIVLGLASAALAGCATVRKVDIDPARLPAPTAAAEATARLPGRIALVMPSTVLLTEVTGERLRAQWPTRLRWPVGRLVEAALLGALDRQFTDSAQRVERQPDAGFTASVRVIDVTLNDDESLRYLIPVPVPGLLFISDYDTSLRLSFELQLVDPRGQPLWTRRYDSGRQLWKRLPHSGEQPTDGLVRVAHDTASQLALQAAQDVRAWVEADRMKPRQL